MFSGSPYTKFLNSVMSSIRKLMFQLLWARRLDTSKVHLCAWDILSAPKYCGGWGTKSVCQVLTKQCVPKVYGSVFSIWVCGAKS